MTELSCAQCQQHAAEVALGVLCGRVRAKVLEHLQSCDHCQDSVVALTSTATRLVELVPDAEPPPAFDRRVLAAVTSPAPARTMKTGLRRAVLLTAGAALIGGGLLFGLPQQVPQAPREPARTQAVQDVADVMVAPLISADHEIGKAYIHPDNPSWIFVSITGDLFTNNPNSPMNTPVDCALLRQDGSSVPLGTFSLANGHAAWGAHAAIDAHTLAGAQLTTDHGHILARAHFTPPPSGHNPGQRDNHDQYATGQRDQHTGDRHEEGRKPAGP